MTVSTKRQSSVVYRRVIIAAGLNLVPTLSESLSQSNRLDARAVRKIVFLSLFVRLKKGFSSPQRPVKEKHSGAIQACSGAQRRYFMATMV